MKSIKQSGISVQDDKTGKRLFFRQEIFELPEFYFVKHVAVQTFALPDGSEGRWESVYEENRTILVAALTGQGNLVLVQQFRFPTHDTYLELPGGGANKGEPMELTARRELLEETGYTTPDKRLPFLLQGPLYSGGTNGRFYLFAALNCSKAHRPKRDAMEKFAGMKTVIIHPHAILKNIYQGNPRCARYDPILLAALVVMHAMGMTSLAP
ncbi:hypothetical protein A3H09_03320 [Candidatus Falkowbacteria bacterium RIFCSPLOWO2_12_FULL_45_13]|uniref:Nudix hydrolase domain-containing protein n=2 Tax=Candidatus Falkowiibacteriota TaxID=1752728 RepID=A0A1F5SAJ1_9BACT|nr:MAG: hypothetical protein A3H66_02350 [Candidatus Falkowbacteria bacterium RIFCSPLOWO2_02_FULL_45_21]OGF32077.1 MAG: hypothetical protein A3H09_03320 [Candidatus Falkowbacteria bacterium RIFCSPLOWO2_12_FULL_45_13]